ncbi:MAG TPA: hypothetical protein VG734_21615 [Lacunisphaera sp.]|nr:hypothetical protein [Lacunisphaera sp.]
MSPAAPQASPLHRLTAVLGIALVLLLNLLAASPELHAWVHGKENAHEHSTPGHEPVVEGDHQCAVTLFAHGAEALLVFCLVMLARLLARSIILRAGDEIARTRPRYWLVPSHAPPVA